MRSDKDIHKKFNELAAEGFTGETVLRFRGSNFDGIYILPKDHKDDDRAVQKIDAVIGLLALCRKFGAFGSITLLWNEGSIKNYTVKLTFQGLDAQFQFKSIFRCEPC